MVKNILRRHKLSSHIKICAGDRYIIDSSSEYKGFKPFTGNSYGTIEIREADVYRVYYVYTEYMESSDGDIMRYNTQRSDMAMESMVDLIECYYYKEI